MKTKHLLAALSGVPLIGLPYNAQAQTEPASTTATAPASVVVTGSRIARASLEGPSAVTILKGEDITRQGYKNVFDALNNQVQNSGFTQGADFGNTFTPSANTISLRGLGPNHTLILLNGRRLADFPVAYDGTVNFTNLANIPSSIVERIEILSGGASAIYGSDAIAGVVNIILKKKFDGVDVNVKAGGTTRGGGAERRLQVTGGRQFDRLSTVFSLELDDRNPIAASQRDFMATRQGTPTNVLSRRDATVGRYIDQDCAQVGGLFGGSVASYASRTGNYCASNKVSPTYWSVQTQNLSKNAFGSATYELNDDTTLFADLLLGRNDTQNNTRGPSWTSSSTNGSYFLNRNTGHYEAWTRYMSPEEMGGVSRYNRHWKDESVAASLGARGHVTGTSWKWEAGYSASWYESKSRTPRALANIDSFFLGPKLGLDSNGIAIYAPDPARLARPLTAAEFDGITGQAQSDDESWTHTLSASANGEVLQLPAGPLQVAAVVEAGRQGFSNRPDERINQGYFNLATTSDVTAGTRTRYAAGVEANIPVTTMLTATLAGRYDRYEFAERDSGKFTYNGGLELRPAKDLLVRANYATSFRAPDMNYIYKARGTGYYASTTDYYRCGLAGQPLSGCEFASVSPGVDYVQLGSKDLKPEKGKSYGAGIVWSPSAAFDASIDYWKIRIDDLVTNLDADQLLRDEAACRLGTQDIGSPTCVDAIARITRFAANSPVRPGEIKEIRVNPINAAQQESSGIDVSAKYALRTGTYGTFTLRGNYAKTLTRRSRQFAADAVKDDLHALDSMDWPDKLAASLNWDRGPWSATLFATRYGKIPNQAQTDYLSPSTLFNTSVVYRVTDRLTVSAIVNNVFNRVKHDDSAGWPNYAVGNYSPAGRTGWVELNYHFL
ncbi:TonB-dependent receptor [Massilia sp. YIM B02763]|uniref:TonB-dependent receptor domain-containing protein n=1 Tax=Massilia sp. YIM B02763 TaxID=3050130 RepID=UPI0025B6C9D1|nr:TonB-dependent receptor [Massilia sp. YIM B02763]MDN4053069.1 TonB-dependent receptor [Massilia sp. YIM B02763]